MSAAERARSSHFQRLLAELRERVVASLRVPEPDLMKSGELARLIHEVDVCYAELDVQNQDLVQTQRQLEEVRDRYCAIFDHAMVPYLSMSSDGLVLDANHAARELLSPTSPLRHGKPFASFVVPEDIDTFFRHLGEAARTGLASDIELTCTFEDSIRSVAMRSSRISVAGSEFLLCHLTDMTEQRRIEAEHEALERRLREVEKVEAIGRVAANIAHEVNNVLVSVISIAEFLEMDRASDPTQVRALLSAAWRGARLMRGLLGLARSSKRPKRPVDLNKLIAATRAQLPRRHDAISVRADLPNNPLWVLGDEDELAQAVVNLATNGLDAMECGTLTLACESVPNSPDKVCIRVDDDGCGMDERTLARVFEPLFTTKAKRGGSGLGMSIVHKVVYAHDGTIDVRSAVGEGTSVRVLLPRIDVPETAEEESRISTPPLGLTILVVDDDASVRATIAHQCRSIGAHFVEAEDGADVLSGLESFAAIDVAILDVNMTDIDGPELAEQLIARFGALPILFVTGGSGAALPPELLAREHVALLRKPWSRHDFAEALELLTRRSC